MIRGYFSDTHLGSDDPAPTSVPLIDVFVYLPAIDAHTTIPFLVDTGADVSVLHPPDAKRLIRTAAQWSTIRAMPREHLSGAGAGLAYFGTPAALFFTDDSGATHAAQNLLWIADADSPLPHESLLGRDVLEGFTLTFRQAARELLLRPL